MEIQQPPELIRGYRAMRAWLKGVGIEASFPEIAKLCEQLNIHGGRSATQFSQAQTRSIVSILADTDYGVWMQRWEASGKTGPLRKKHMILNVPRAQRFSGVWSLLRDEGGESVVRTKDGNCFVAFTQIDFWRWPVEAREYATACARFKTSRLALPADFTKPPEPKATALICCRVMRKGIMRSVRVPGETFGVDGRTPLIAPVGWPDWPLWRVRVQAKLPDAVWSYYDNREELDRITRQRLSGGADSIQA